MSLTELCCLAERVVTERTTASQLVCNSPAVVFSLTLVSDSGGAATATLYDGSSTKAVKKVDFACIEDDMHHLNYLPPMYMTRGIYAEHGSNITSLVVRYTPISE
jgi:hypothetical protein